MLLHTKEEIIINLPPRTGQYHALAEAIREGCKLAPAQCFYMPFADAFGNSVAAPTHEGSRQRVWQACVVGAIYLVGWPEGDRGNRPCPVCGEERSLSTLVHLNNEHRWSRERIADWLDTF